MYRGERTVGPLVHKLVAALGQAYDLEIVLVDDGSPDDSARVCRELADEFSQVRFLGLSKNYGEHNAVMAGLNHAGGDCVVIMDDDFQNPPEEVGRLVEELRRGYDVVFSCYEKKRHSRLRNLGSRFNNYVASLLLNKPRDLYLVELQGPEPLRRRRAGQVHRPVPLYRRPDPPLHPQLLAGAGPPRPAGGGPLGLHAERSSSASG